MEGYDWWDDSRSGSNLLNAWSEADGRLPGYACLL